MSLTDDDIQDIHDMYAKDRERFDKFLKKLEKIARQWSECNYDDYINSIPMSKKALNDFKKREETLNQCGAKIQQLIRFYKTKEHY